MTKTAHELDFDALAKLAKAATEGVRADAARVSVALPVWRDGAVAYQDAGTGAVSSAPAVSEQPPRSTKPRVAAAKNFRPAND